MSKCMCEGHAERKAGVLRFTNHGTGKAWVAEGRNGDYRIDSGDDWAVLTVFTGYSGGVEQGAWGGRSALANALRKASRLERKVA